MVTAQSLLKEAESKMKKAEEITVQELSRIRGGRAQTAMVEGIKVDYYGTPTPLKQLAGITTPDPRSITIQPWDPSAIAEIEKAILKAGLGMTPQNDGKVVRLNLPALTKERRDEMIKLARKVAEDGRVSIRAIRRDENESVKKIEKEGVVAEDESRKTQEQVQKLTDRFIVEIDKHLKQKEIEIQEV
ncbi:MAG: ribosome recycling factor [Candidatus Omnitrophica bacterium]|nr:ribosome recycling factor [Candidatus Omnitrophota bacterium]